MSENGEYGDGTEWLSTIRKTYMNGCLIVDIEGEQQWKKPYSEKTGTVLPTALIAVRCTSAQNQKTSCFVKTVVRTLTPSHRHKTDEIWRPNNKRTLRSGGRLPLRLAEDNERESLQPLRRLGISRRARRAARRLRDTSRTSRTNGTRIQRANYPQVSRLRAGLGIQRKLRQTDLFILSRQTNRTRRVTPFFSHILGRNNQPVDTDTE